MFSLSLAAVLLFGASAHAQDGVTGTFPPVPLASKHFAYPSGIPYKVDTDQGLIRGTQAGYNLCNSTTEGPTSMCQTSFLNGLDDFCLWAPSAPNSMVADTEGEMVAWCTKPGRGTRIIPAGALQGVQFMKTPDYVQVVGFIDQRLINLAPDDFGGEMDPHGADLRGNPMGGIVYSTAFGTGGQFEQVIEWHNFMGGNAFCFKVCDPSRPNAAHYCEHIYDRIGCAFNAPNNAQNGTFEACEGENQDFPGVYTTNGQVVTYTQPPEALGPITSMPYTARIPASSNCVPHPSSAIFTALPSPSIPPMNSAVSVSSSAAPTGSTATRGGSGASGTKSGSPSATQSPDSASTLAMSTASILGVVFAALFFS